MTNKRIPESDDCYGATHFDPFDYQACAFLAISPTGYGLQSRKPDNLKGSMLFIAKNRPNQVISKPSRFLFSLIALLFLSSGAATPDNSVRFFNQANKYYSDGEYKKAIILYRKAGQSGADPSIIAFNIGNCYYQSGDLPSAAATYRNAVDLSGGKLNNALLNLAAVHYQLRNYGESIAAYRRALGKDPGNVSAWLYLAEATGRSGDLIGAQRALEAALDIDKQDLSIIYQLAEIHLKLDEVNRAVELVRQVYEQKPTETDLLFYIGDIYYNDKNHEMAIAAWREGLLAQPDNYSVHYRLADLLVQNENRFLAMEHLTRALEIKPDFTDAALFLGNIAFDLQWWDRSQQAYQQALKNGESEGIVGIVNIIYELIKRGDLQGANSTAEILSDVRIQDPLVLRDWNAVKEQLAAKNSIR